IQGARLGLQSSLSNPCCAGLPRPEAAGETYALNEFRGVRPIFWALVRDPRIARQPLDLRIAEAVEMGSAGRLRQLPDE
ncbi:MAG: hypothetical protein ACREU7_12050, partial [Burkholderiales bacterium]